QRVSTPFASPTLFRSHPSCEADPVVGHKSGPDVRPSTGPAPCASDQADGTAKDDGIAYADHPERNLPLGPGAFRDHQFQRRFPSWVPPPPPAGTKADLTRSWRPLPSGRRLARDPLPCCLSTCGCESAQREPPPHPVLKHRLRPNGVAVFQHDLGMAGTRPPQDGPATGQHVKGHLVV